MNGIDFIRTARPQIYGQLPLTMVTTHSEEDYRSEAVAAEANEVCPKAGTLDALRQRLDSLGLLES